MARQINQIEAQVIAEKSKYTELDEIDSASQTAIWRLWVYVFSVCVSVLENLTDVFKSELETTVSRAIPGTPAWIAYMVRKWQAGDIVKLQTNPNSNIFLTFFYPGGVNIAKQIVTRVYVSTGFNRTIIVKVAKSAIPEPLDATEQAQLRSYLKQVVGAGLSFNLISANADKVAISANIYFDGQYTQTIEDSVKQALADYFANLDFNALVKVSKIQDTIQAITGVNDVVITNCQIRNDSQSFGGGQQLVYLSQVILKDTTPYSGYVVEETETGHSFTDTLVFTAQ